MVLLCIFAHSTRLYHQLSSKRRREYLPMQAWSFTKHFFIDAVPWWRSSASFDAAMVLLTLRWRSDQRNDLPKKINGEAGLKGHWYVVHCNLWRSEDNPYASNEDIQDVIKRPLSNFTIRNYNHFINEEAIVGVWRIPIWYSLAEQKYVKPLLRTLSVTPVNSAIMARTLKSQLLGTNTSWTCRDGCFGCFRDHCKRWSTLLKNEIVDQQLRFTNKKADRASP